MRTKTITQSIALPARPAKVYAALINAREHAAFTGVAAHISPKAGGRFDCYGGYLGGFTLELTANKRIVQAWRSRGWPKGHYSIVTFALAAIGRGKSRLRFTQSGVPAGDFKAKSSGWHTHYWEPLKRYLAGAK